MNETASNLQPGTHNSEQLLDALARVLASKTFAEVFRLKKFLEYVVTETIAGRGDRLKGFVIACDVFGKEDPSDAQTTTVVRVEAGRLRRRLKDYYESEGRCWWFYWSCLFSRPGSSGQTQLQSLIYYSISVQPLPYCHLKT